MFSDINNIILDDFKQICRTCLFNQDLNLFQDNIKILNILQNIVGIDFTVEDELPQQICKTCVNRIHEIQIFILRCKEIDLKLKECLAKFRYNETKQLTKLNIKEEIVIEESKLFQKSIEFVKVENNPEQNDGAAVPKGVNKFSVSVKDEILSDDDSTTSLNTAHSDNQSNFIDIQDFSVNYDQPQNIKASKANDDVKRSRKLLTLQEKLDLIKLSEQGMSNAVIGRKLNLPRTTVSTIVKNKAKVLDEIKNATPLHTKVIRKRDSLIADMEKLLNVWIQDQTSHQIGLSQAIIQAKALSLFNTMKTKRGEASAEDKFEASRGWFDRFKARANLHNIKIHGEAASADDVIAKKFLDEFIKIIEDGGFTTQQIFNVCETGLYWKKMPSKTYIASEENSIPGFKAAKDRLTLLLGANAAGDFKLKPMLIYQSENPRALKNYLKTSLPVYFKSSRKAWMTSDLFTTWFSDYFRPTVEAYCKEQSIPFNILLLVDNTPYHLASLDDFCREIRVAFLPPNTASILQPMNQGVIAAFKSYYLKSTFTKATAALEADCDEISKKNKFERFWKNLSILDGIKTIRDAWAEVNESKLKCAWKKLIPTMIHDCEELEDTISEVTANVVEMAGQLEMDVEAADVAELLQSHDDPLSDEDLLAVEAHRRILNEQDAQLDTSFLTPRLMTVKEIEEGLSLTDKACTYWEKIDSNFERSSKVNIIMQNAVACYKELLKEKKQMSKHQALLTYISTQQQLSTDPFKPITLASVITSTRSPAKPHSPKRIKLFNFAENEDTPQPSFFSAT